MRRGRTTWILATLATTSLLPLLMGQGCLPSAPSDEARAQVVDVSPADAQAMIDSHASDPNFVIIDVRTPVEYAGGHIANAINICVMGCTTSFTDGIAGLDKTKTYLVYCGTNHRSPTATGIMIEQGFTSVYNMLGGLTQWVSEGRPTVQ